MATEQTPPELASRDARRRRREFNSLVWLCGWGGVTAGAPLAFAIASQTDTASKRLRRVFAARESSAALRVTQLESDSQLLAAQVRALVAERDRLSGRIALLESSIDDMSGAIKKQAAATAAVLAAKEIRRHRAQRHRQRARRLSRIKRQPHRSHRILCPRETLPRQSFLCCPLASRTRPRLRMTNRRKSKQSSASTWAAERR